MASGNSVLDIALACPPGTLSAGLRYIVGGATPAENIPLWLFDDTTDEYIDYLVRLTEEYDGGGLTLTLKWSATSATSGNVVWSAAFRRINDDAEDFDTTAHSYSFQSVTDAAPSAVGEVVYPTIAFTDGAQMDSLAAGEIAILRMSRDANNGSDTMSGDSELWSVSGKET